VGPEWTPTERTHVSASYGRRYFGPSRTFHLDHRSRLTLWGFDYSESVTTTRANLTTQVPSELARLIDANLQANPAFQDAAVRQAEVQRVINGLQAAGFTGVRLTDSLNFLSDSLFLDKRLQGTFGIQGLTNTIISNVFSSNRKALSTGTSAGADFVATQTLKQTGASLSWNAQLGPTLASNLTLGVTRVSFGSLNRTDHRTSMRWGLTKQFDPKLSGAFSLGRLKNDSNLSQSSYSENSVSATLGMRF
jgi:uncharacterized protein (PEP-CTERM system associated)